MVSHCWLLKAEPESRVVKGKDVKFSVDDFEAVKTSPWEGVRNYEARNLMKEMRVGDKALFYHSNCKNPGIAAFAEVSKEAYPDCKVPFSHPYYDHKTDKDEPRWFMVDLTFKSRAKHFVPLSLLKRIVESEEVLEDISYIGEEGCKAVKEMDLVTRGRLSVQRVTEPAWCAIQMLAETGGWSDSVIKKTTNKRKRTKKAQHNTASTKRRKAKPASGDGDEDEQSSLTDLDDLADEEQQRRSGKRVRNKRKHKSEDEEAHPKVVKRASSTRNQ
ncbi:hypothetical protein AMATHDRAFT_75778 [Amanita thiersii Skay4041]|uniref:EVE domain-containing protein n=1 Tax=Amanita thiersii Skay4041 TaxID=703135 RepID=A0A2A9NHS6_9AGAR|nr:hypothetical protein AMATHDRAFT_75778 [Amanita thiersii Skay4041]